jgi:hypothetical protein
MYGKAQLEGGFFNGRRGELQASARRPVWLANNRGNFRYLREGSQRRDRNLRRTEEHRAHDSRAYSAS